MQDQSKHVNLAVYEVICSPRNACEICGRDLLHARLKSVNSSFIRRRELDLHSGGAGYRSPDPADDQAVGSYNIVQVGNERFCNFPREDVLNLADMGDGVLAGGSLEAHWTTRHY